MWMIIHRNFETSSILRPNFQPWAWKPKMLAEVLGAFRMMTPRRGATFGWNWIGEENGTENGHKTMRLQADQGGGI